MGFDETRRHPPATADGLSPKELEAEVVLELPDREALSVAFPLGIAAAPAAASKGAASVAAAVEDAPLDPSA